MNLAGLNKEQLFTFSSDIFGKPIGFYSKRTEEITGGRKKQGQPFNLVETGDFFKGFFAKVKGQEVLFGSTDSKTMLILTNPSLFSNSIFGLTDSSLEEVIEETIKPFYMRTIRRKLNI